MLAALAIASTMASSTMAVGCRNKPAAPEDPLLGETSPIGDVDFAPYLAAARAIITHGSMPPAPATALAGRRAFVTVWSPAHPAVGTGIGDTLFASISAAAQAIAVETASDAEASAAMAENARLQIDVVTGAEIATIATGMIESSANLGLFGYLAAPDRTHVGFVLPTEIIAFKYFDASSLESGLTPMAVERLWPTLATRAGVEESALQKVSTYRIKTASYVESVEPPGRAIPVVRAMPPRPEKMTPVEIVAAARAGAEYLSRALDDEGRFRYYYHPVEGTSSRRYGLIRHACATYALLEAYEETREPRYLEKAELALGYLEPRYRTASVGVFLTDSMREEQQRVGGTGVALMALAKHAEITGKRTNLERMRALARYIMHQQYPDGHYRANADVMREDPAAQDEQLPLELFYYPGEATLGLLRLYRVDKQPKLLEAARKAADFLVNQRDGQDDEEHQIHDHWLSYVLLDLYRETKEPTYAGHAFKIARSIVKKESTVDKPAPDYAGSFKQGHSTPTSTRLEALASDLELSRMMGMDHLWLDGPAMRLACFMRGQQFDANSSYFTKNPDQAIGGLRESLVINDIRIDYVQHAMSAWLHFARVLRDPGYGKAPASADAGNDQ